MAGRSIDQSWQLLKDELPNGWQEAARRLGAIRRSQGPLADPELLLRMILGHAASDLANRPLVAHARQTGLAAISDVALHKREMNCGDWLEWIADKLLGETLTELPETRLRLRLVDATTASRPGSTGTDFRLHVCVDLPARRFTQAELTDAKGGETFERFEVQPGDLMVGDRIYATARGVRHVVMSGGHPLVRANASSLPFFGSGGCRVDPLLLGRTLRPGEMTEVDVLVAPRAEDAIAGRLCIFALPEEEARKAERRAQKKRHGRRRPGARAVESAKYIFLFTTAPRTLLTLSQVFLIYRLRWQIELAFKTIKTVLKYGRLPKRRSDTGRTWLLGKLVCALLLERLAHLPAAAISPESAAA
jgi:hypothetical protein